MQAAQTGGREYWRNLLVLVKIQCDRLRVESQKINKDWRCVSEPVIVLDLLRQYHKITFFLCYHPIIWVLGHLRSQWLVQHMKRRCQKWRYWGSEGFILLAQMLFPKGQRCLQICYFSITQTFCDWNNWLFTSQEHLAFEWDYYYEFCYCTSNKVDLEWLKS